ncbi:MAG: serine/threonine-protein phosphatase [Aquificae bacterium]|nr:serine/threonine-protein phosphatase [Aquificota bacterium]
MRLKVAYVTNAGKWRPRNEDALLVDGKVIAGVSMSAPVEEELSAEAVPLAVADGLGGHACGHIASALALEALIGARPRSEEEVVSAVLRAKERLDAYVEEHGECYGMGTALAGVFMGSNAFVFNVGDCRVYRFRGGELELLTQDHTYVFELFLEGRISYEELRKHPERNVLTSALIGGYPEVPDVFVRKITPEGGDFYLICSDGLWEALSLGEMVSCFGKGNPLESALCMFSLAYSEGRDNISLILAQVLSP